MRAFVLLGEDAHGCTASHGWGMCTHIDRVLTSGIYSTEMILNVWGIGPILISKVSPTFFPRIAFPSGALDVMMTIVSESAVIDSPPAHGPKKRVRLSLPSVDSSLTSALSRIGVVLSNSLSVSCCRDSSESLSS